MAALRGLVDVQFRQSATRVLLPVVYLLGLLLAFEWVGAMTVTGVAAVMAVLCVLTMLLGQFISNVATVLIVTPIAAAISRSCAFRPAARPRC